MSESESNLNVDPTTTQNVSPSNPPIVSVRKITRTFAFGDTEIHALNGLDLDISPGEFIVILGPSGAGKTTLLNMIGGIDNPTSGTIMVDNEQLEGMSNEELNSYRRNKVGWIFQFFNIVDSLRAWENVALSLEFQGIKDKKVLKEKAYKILEEVGLKDKELRFPSQLSGGEQQRVAIARALVKKPKIVVADEPTGNLDYITGQTIAELMQNLNKKEKITFIVVSHDVSITKYADRVYHLKSGQIHQITDQSSEKQALPASKKIMDE